MYSPWSAMLVAIELRGCNRAVILQGVYVPLVKLPAVAELFFYL